MSEEQKTILIVDDDPDICVYLSTFFQDNGYATITAKDGAEALEKVKASRPDLITLDISMPETSGVRMYRDIKESAELKDIPVIIVTGISKDFERFISTRKQVPPPEGYISKPIDQDEMLKLIEKLT